MLLYVNVSFVISFVYFVVELGYGVLVLFDYSIIIVFDSVSVSSMLLC